ncbi:MAG: tRNA (adenosine(37)-N6)-threonylcarbamoyltransferase complex ATPase subunit type 1 TsaE [Pyrinomonadaceae bacterium]|nr:tRNA (adenosine(37)-N6)-threonylcarbamoyltransferase complex ATPase subunit type 1 TsaE [Pyrinomonadaceae bacterium]
MTTQKFKIQSSTFKEMISNSPDQTFEIAEIFGEDLKGGEVVLLEGDLGAGKTLFTKGVLQALHYDVDEVTSPSFTLVNLYKCHDFNVYHIDLWRLNENSDVASAVGLDEILEEENAIVIIEWSERLKDFSFPNKVFRVKIIGDGDEPRTIEIETSHLSSFSSN